VWCAVLLALTRREGERERERGGPATFMEAKLPAGSGVELARRSGGTRSWSTSHMRRLPNQRDGDGGIVWH
jgi:hypothetical protein